MSIVASLVIPGGIALTLVQMGAKESSPHLAALARRITFGGARFDVVDVPLERFELHAVWRPGGSRLGDVPGIVRTNAGIFDPGFVPAGLLVSRGAATHPLNTRTGQGNFYLAPNGVFAVRRGAGVIEETSVYDAGGVSEATQSGPLLLWGGHIHPAFVSSSPNKTIRNAVGVRDGAHVVLVISRDPVNLWTLAALFRDELHCASALYLDGAISALWAEGAGLDEDLKKGPFAGVLTVEPRRLAQ